MSPRNTATDRLLRRLALLTYLGSHQEATFARLARHFGVPLRDVVDDVLALWTTNGRPDDDTTNFVDFEVDVDEDVDLQGRWDPAVVGPARVRLLQGQNLDRPVPLSTGESVSLMAGLRQIAELMGPAGPDADPVRQAVDSALAKLTAVAPVVAETTTAAGAHPVDPDVRATIWRATNAGKRLRLRYVSGGDEETVREVDPVEVHGESGHWLLTAWCHRARGERSFRLDRVREAVELRTAVDPRHLERHTDAAGAAPDDGPRTGETVRLIVSSRALWHVDDVPHEEVEDLGDGRLRVTLTVANRAWLAGFLLRLGALVQSADPPSAAADAARRAHRALEAYAALDPLGDQA